ncbi:flagellar biosynthesis protein FlhB [Cohnella lubricantis]|uniref:Flagellar biosynthetic protein FlhB n=1 Tax=Cohnella lubricantis TaxID=2163172 RepID=A0A841THL3_9BACL|nr:flagellar biosynthesis protein FlhB [Cohnella lubricantis]MBB6679399.1 flagellar biosynthesis protein FlhB [Cohnella lubricantis]MBP2117481.1 flagellar biosynthetic protein FlhB [Cohnella lubricantis]
MARYQLRMDLQLFAGEKTEKATPKKRNDARNKGQVAKSQELVSSVALIVCASLFLMLGSFFWERILRLFSDVLLHGLTMEVTEANVLGMLSRYSGQMLIFLAPIFIAVIVTAFAVSYMQIGFLFTTEPLKFKLSVLDPINGFKKLFGVRSLVEFAKSMLKLFATGLIVYLVLWSAKDRVLMLAHVPIVDIFSYTGSLTIRLTLLFGVLMFVLAIGDYYYQKYSYEKSLRMSKQDIKDEHKNAEGDPLIKGKIRERQRRMAIMRMMQEVPKADVIITNPTHFAVALQYDGTKMDAPKVIAKGQDYLALRIREIAKQHNVITMENKPLARALYDRTEIGDSIPADLFQAVAEVLAYVYRLKGGRRRG